VEFIVAPDGAFYFMEMNTRLQIEHPITEMVTGIDLVKQQIRVAAGEKLPFAQRDIHWDGHAIEVRLTANDPERNFAPSAGRIQSLRLPGGLGVRVDTHVFCGYDVPPYYDSMLAKIIAFGADRQQAAQRLSAALGEFAILGVTSSQGFLRDIIDQPVFRAGKLSTRFIAETFPDGWAGRQTDDADLAAAAAIWAAAGEALRAEPDLGPWTTLGGFRVTAPSGRAGRVSLDIAIGSETVASEIAGAGGHYVVRRGERDTQVEIATDGHRAAIRIDGIARDYSFAIEGKTVSLGRDGSAARLSVAPRIENAGNKSATQAGGEGRIQAPMPGLIRQLNVEPGQTVAIGDTVIVMEAMKLMYSLPAQVSGTVKGVFCAVGDTVPTGAPLVEIEAD
jgi:acetyl/propionyl-CoA carboxylase alpha subunit